MAVGRLHAIRGRVLAAALLVALAAADLRAQETSDHRLLFTPSPLGAPVWLESNGAIVPVPPGRPAAPERDPTPTAAPAPQVDWSKSYFDRPGIPFDSGTSAGFRGAQPPTVDSSPHIDLGGISLGLETGRSHDGGASGNLRSPEANDPVPPDPALAVQRRSGTPFLGLSLSAPTK
jgi:hypothetical protein